MSDTPELKLKLGWEITFEGQEAKPTITCTLSGTHPPLQETDIFAQLEQIELISAIKHRPNSNQFEVVLEGLPERPSLTPSMLIRLGKAIAEVLSESLGIGPLSITWQ